MLLSLLLRGVGMGGSAQASAPSLGLPHIIISLDPDDAEYPEGFALFFRPPWVATALESGEVVDDRTILEIDRDPEDTPRSRRIVEVVKQNFDFHDDKIAKVESVQPFGVTTVLFDEAGDHYWTCPPNVTSVTVEVCGAGGNGGADVLYGVREGAGGGGGGYASGTVPVTPGSVYIATVAAVDDPPTTTAADSEYDQVQASLVASEPSDAVSEFYGDDGIYIQANSGASAFIDFRGEGGSGLAGTTLRTGGNGGAAATATGGGGGGSAGNSSNGGSGTSGGIVIGGPGGTSGGTDSGAGGHGGNQILRDGVHFQGEDGTGPGAGGGGNAESALGVAGKGQPGFVRITWTVQQFADGDYGDITIADDVMTIDAGAVTEAKQTLADNTTNDVTSTKHGYAPKSPGDATKFLNGAATPAYALVKDSDLSTTDITTNNATSAKHGFLPKLSNVDRNVLSGDGSWQARGTIILEDQKSSSTAGGTFTSGAWRTRTLNTEVTDSNGDCTLASDQFTLAAGTYEIEASAPAGAVNRHQIRLQNITDTTTDGTGTSEFNAAASAIQTRSHLRVRITIAGAKAFEIQHQCETTSATNGFGVPGSFGTEVYTTVFIRRVK